MPTATPRRRFLQSALALCAPLPLPPALAADGKVVLGFFPGPNGVPGMAAVLKAMQGRYQPDLGLKLNYMPGNSGALAIDAVHKAPADGGTVLLTPSSLMTMMPLLRTLPGVDPATDFVPVAALSELGVGFVIGDTVPREITQLKDYLDWVRKNPTLSNYGVPGLGTVPHLLGALMAESADLPLKAVAYKGMASLIDDLSYGSLPAAFMPRAVASGLARAGRARLLAVGSADRWASQAVAPTLAELRVIDFDPIESQGFFVSSRTPPEKVRELRQAVRQTLQSPELASAFAAEKLSPPLADAPDYADQVLRERQLWAAIIKKHRFTLAS